MVLEGGNRITLYREADGTLHDIDAPPSSKIDIHEVSRELALPGYIELDCCPLQRAIATIWASLNSPTLLAGHPDAKKIGGPLKPLLMGGAAVKILCPTANIPGGPMNRRLKDLDYVVRRDHGSKFVMLLTNLGSLVGTRYHHFLTSGDRRFNAIRAGERYRVRSVDWTDGMEPIVNWVDVLVEKVEMRHTIDVRDELSMEPRSFLYTIGAEKLLLTKCQMIAEVESKDVDAFLNSGQGFRVLRCPWYRSNRLVIGMEEKDILDACALLHDQIIEHLNESVTRIARLILKDQRFSLTFRLNLLNIIDRFDFLRERGLSDHQLSKIEEAVNGLLKTVPDGSKKWDKPWWNTDVDTPVIV